MRQSPKGTRATYVTDPDRLAPYVSLGAVTVTARPLTSRGPPGRPGVPFTDHCVRCKVRGETRGACLTHGSRFRSPAPRGPVLATSNTALRHTHSGSLWRRRSSGRRHKSHALPATRPAHHFSETASASAWMRAELRHNGVRTKATQLSGSTSVSTESAAAWTQCVRRGVRTTGRALHYGRAGTTVASRG